MNKCGLSLVEILIATGIFLIAMIPIWGLMGSSHQQVMRSSDEIKASQLTVEVLEQMENNLSLSILPGDGEETDWINLNSEGGLTLGKDSNKKTIKIGSFDSYFLPQLKISCESVMNWFSDEKEVGRIVTLTMKYRSKEGRELKYVLRGFISAN